MQVEIRSINSKTLDLSLKLPSEYRELEPEFRSRIAAGLLRGKVECVLSFLQKDAQGNAPAYRLNIPQVERYLEDFKKISESFICKGWGGAMPDPGVVFLLPSAVQEDASQVMDEEFKQAVMQTLDESIALTDASRLQEGSVLEKDFRLRVAEIEKLAYEVEPFEAQRVPRIRQRMEKQLAEWDVPVEVDRNRLEQEMIYYLEKLDMTEEKVRLHKHCRYFMETMETEEAPGRKLAFIAQEMGREINTLGSKANEADIQKLVVRMKDELEKIKEQLFNIL